MIAFLDTNVWLSARFRPGLCSELLDALVEHDARILLDERVFDEFRRIARDRLHVDEVALARAEVFFHQYTEIVPAAKEPTAGIPDPDDAWIIAAALRSDAEYFVTGDQALLDLGRIGPLSIVNPREAWTLLYTD